MSSSLSSSPSSLLPSSLPPEILKFLKWLEATSGRDKIYRFVAYFSKFVIQILKNNGADNHKDIIERLTKGASAIGVTRKLLRFFRSIEYLQEFLKSLNIQKDSERFLSIVKAISLFIWMVCDHLQWLHKVGYIKVGEYIKKIDEYHSKSWAVGLLCGLILSIQKYHICKEEMDKVKRSLPSSSSTENSALLLSLEEKKSKQMMGIVKNGLDFVIPTARLGWITVSDGTVGLAGAITSVIGMVDTWPKK